MQKHNKTYTQDKHTGIYCIYIYVVSKTIYALDDKLIDHKYATSEGEMQNY